MQVLAARHLEREHGIDAADVGGGRGRFEGSARQRPPCDGASTSSRLTARRRDADRPRFRRSSRPAPKLAYGGEQLLDVAWHNLARRPVAALGEPAVDRAGLEVELDRVRPPVAPDLLDEARSRIDLSRSTNRNEQIAGASACSIASSSSGISPNHTTCGRSESRPPHVGQRWPAARSSRQPRTAAQPVQRVFSSSPCMWIRLREPARSCRSSIFCVTICTGPGHCRSSSASAQCAAFGATSATSSCRRRRS